MSNLISMCETISSYLRKGKAAGARRQVGKAAGTDCGSGRSGRPAVLGVSAQVEYLDVMGRCSWSMGR